MSEGEEQAAATPEEKLKILEVCVLDMLEELAQAAAARLPAARLPDNTTSP